MDLLSTLNAAQRRAVTAEPGPVLVLAGPGSGKTRVLTHRIAYLIGALGARPYHIMAVTFTNKAAREMEKRVGELLGENTRGLTLGTFHAICARLLRREAAHLPFTSSFVIFDADDQLNLVKRAIADENIDEKKFRAPGVHASISNAKNELILPDDYPQRDYRDEKVARIYQRYQKLLLACNAVDFDDLLLYTARLLDENPEVRERYARRYEHILVDEFQDTNLAQYTLLRHLGSHFNNLFVVGDADQSIYSWRGADYRNVQRFEKDYPGAQVVLLEQNYRSTQNILDAAMAVIDRNPHRTPKRLFTERGEGMRVTLHETYDDRQEAAFIVDTIASLVKRRQAQPGDCAVMYRTNAQSRLLEEAFLTAGLPYKLVGAQRFYGRREVKDVIAFMRLVHNPSDELSLSRVVNVPPRGIGDKTYQSLRTLALQAGMAPGVLLLDLGRVEESRHLAAFSGRGAGALVNLGMLMQGWAAGAGEWTPLQLMDRVLSDVEYQAYLDDGSEEGRERWDNVSELRRLAAEYQEKGLDAFLENIALVSDQDTLEAGANVPTLLTLHAAKGLEYPIVFIVGLSDGTLPHSRSLEDPEAMQEERRLFYVGITRAKDRLFLVQPQHRSTQGFAEPTDPSRFLDDIPENLLDEMQPGRSGRMRGGGRAQDDYEAARWTPAPGSPPRRAPAPRAVAQFAPGGRVQHPVWGEGMVLNSRLEDDDEIVDVFFENVGLKRLAASLARLRPLEK